MGSTRCHQFLIIIFLVLLHTAHSKVVCIEREKLALLNLKKGFGDPSKRLLSWMAEEEDCCLWNGIGCDNKTGHVTMLDLHNSDLTGRIRPSIQDLHSLNYLDLSLNQFDEMLIPNFLGSLTELRYLNLSMAAFFGSIPSQLGNLSNLQYLDLSDYYYRQAIYFDNLDWLSGLSSLRYLNMSRTFAAQAMGDWLEKINYLSSLRELHMNECNLGEISSFPTHVNFTSLKVFDLHLNNLSCSILHALANVTSLTYLDISSNGLDCSLSPIYLVKLTSLSHLDLSHNFLTGPIPDVFTHTPSLEYLDLSGNKFTRYLPQSIRQVSELLVFNVGGNTLEGMISDSYFVNMSKLRKLDISSNSFTCNFTLDWIPPLGLNELGMSSCTLGPNFPPWLRSLKNLSHLDISRNGISGTIPSWYWSISSNMHYMILSHNYINGNLPLTSVFLNEVDIDLSSNHFEGPIPQISPNITSLNLSKNFFSGTISALLCKVLGVNNALSFLDLSDNRLSGSIPDCWMHWSNFAILSLANNFFSGQIPTSIGYMVRLRTLHLRNNNLSGGLPSSLKNCTQLYAMDVAENRLSGFIPPWIGLLTNLMYLVMHSNQFNGRIPSHLCRLNNLCILDLADNNLQGTIPNCLANFTVMANYGWTSMGYSQSEANYEENTMVIWKGKKQEYKEILRFVKMIDLSSNKLSGVIPEDVTDLVYLIALNLSRNCLTGTIPSNMSHMGSLEFLDLSRNQLSGAIPTELSSLTLLNGLDLSYNNLSGTIPQSTQLQSFEASSFIGNPKLCGLPLSECVKGKTVNQGPTVTGNGDGKDIPWFYIGIGVGYILGFWGVCACLLFNRSWRIAYFRFVDEVNDWVYVATTVNLRKLQRRLGNL